ncbi:hypothetical protein ASG73_16345 [Janibacter sp. Soil728]|nr:hypothetical protein ASG73_16345 [Janibacter sp. Soil728]
MRILLITDHYAPEMGAPQQRWDGLAGWFIDNGHDVAILTPLPHHPSGKAWPETEHLHPGSVQVGAHGEVIHRVGYRPTTGSVWSVLADQLYGAAQSVWTARRFRGSARPDIVIATVPALPSLPAGVAISRLMRRPLVLEMRDAWPDLLAVIDRWEGDRLSGGQHVKRALAKVAALTTSQLQRRASVVVTTTHSFAEQLRARRFRHVRVIRNAAHPFSAPLELLPREPAGELRVVYVGTVGRAQGLETGVEAARLARLDGVTVHLRIVGGGAGRALVQEAARESGIDVELLGIVPRTQVPAHYAWADTALVMLRDWPGLLLTIPSKVYELMDAGMHISASVSGEAADVIDEAGGGDVVPAGNARALADLWIDLARADGPPLPLPQAKTWVEQHARRTVTGEQYLGLLGELHVAVGDRGLSGGQRLRALADNAALLATTAADHLDDDHVSFAVLVMRRLPAPLRNRLAGSLTALRSRPTAAALGHVLADRPERARTDLERAAPSRLRDELELVLSGTFTGEGRLAARALWAGGEITAAIAALEGSARRGDQRYAHRLRSELRLLTSGHRLAVPPSPAPRPRARRRSVTHILTNSLPHTSSGYALRTHAILQAQSAVGIRARGITRPGYPVIVGAPWARGTDFVDGVPYHRVLGARLPETTEERLELWAEAVVDLGARSRTEVLHATTHYPNALVAQAAAKSLGIPWVYEIRGQLEKTWATSRPLGADAVALASERYRLWRAREIEMACAADAVVTLSEALRDDLVVRGVPPERITIVPNAVDASLLVEAPPAHLARRRLELPEDGIWVGTVSSIVGYEGLSTLVDAIALAREAGADIRGAIVGDGVARPALLDQVQRLGLEEHVLLPGRVSRGTARLWHQALDVFTVPRRDVEVARTVTPLKPIEAMAVGRPVVASDLPALAEIVDIPGSGLLVRPDDPDDLARALVRLAGDETLRSDLGLRGRAFAETRTWSALTHRYATLYDRLTAAEVSG